MKTMAKILAIALIFVMTLTLVGCGPKAKIKGEWEGSILGVKATYEFKDKEVTIEAMGEKETVPYEIDGDTLIIDDEEFEYEFDGRKTLYIEADGIKIEFKKK